MLPETANINLKT